ncbi:hypothetical protein JMJ77_0011307, partial [Colletotrichum scovillei]
MIQGTLVLASLPPSLVVPEMSTGNASRK